jgi:hypothetical protein
MQTRCEKNGCRPRINPFGVSWCVDCGKIFPFSLNHKSLDRNSLIEEHRIQFELSLNKK